MVTEHPCFNPLSSKKFFPVGNKVCFQQRKLLFIFQVGNRLLLEALVEAGADLNVQVGEQKWSPMMSAAFDGNYELVKYFKNLGVNLDLVSNKGTGINKLSN